MKDSFPLAMKFTLNWEKYRSENPNDPGGLTIWGFCQRDFPDEVAQMLQVSEVDAKVMAIRFYAKYFWLPLKCDDILSPLDMVIFDIGVNQGKAIAKEILEAAANWQDALLLRIDRYDDLKGFDNFGRGWSKRVISLRDYITSGYQVIEWDMKEFYKGVKA